MNILITGATGGIGKELIKHLSKDNKIIAIARNIKNLKEFKKEVNDKQLIILALDVSNPRKVKKAINSLNNLDVLINCAALLKPVGLLLNNDIQNWKKTLEVNLLGTVYLCYYCLPLLLKSRKGKIINFAGGGSAYPRPYHTAYGTSKAAVVRFTETIAYEYPELDINVISPGAYKTKMWQEETFDPEPKEWGDMERLKIFIDYLISKKSDGITGKFIHYKDNWENFNPKKLSRDIYTLRRIEK